MDDTGAIVFVKGYSQDDEYAYEHGMGDDEEAWFSMPDAQTIYGSDMPERLVETKEARDWIESCESHFADIPFTLLFKDKQDEFTGVVTVKGKQTGNDKVRIRRTPDRKGKILASLKVGTELTVTGEENGYYSVEDLAGKYQNEVMDPYKAKRINEVLERLKKSVEDETILPYLRLIEEPEETGEDGKSVLKGLTYSDILLMLKWYKVLPR